MYYTTENSHNIMKFYCTLLNEYSVNIKSVGQHIKYRQGNKYQIK